MAVGAPAGLRTLLIDDNPDDRELVKRELRRAFSNLETEEILDAHGFMEALRAYPPDLAITDYQLGWTNGLAVLDAIKDRFPECTVVMFTGTGSEEIAVTALKAGLDDYVLKSPGHCARLPTAVRLGLEHSKQRRAVREAEARYRGLFDRAPLGLYRTTPEGRIVDANPAMRELLGHPSMAALAERDVAELLADPEAYRQWRALVAAGNAAGDMEVQLRRHDGTMIWVRERLGVFRDSQGRIKYFEGAAQDITARRQTEEALRENAELLEGILSNSPAVVYIKDLDGRYIRVNRRFETLFHVGGDEVRGRTDADIFPRGVAEAFRAHDRNVLAANAPLTLEEVAPHDDGLHTYVSIKFPVRDADGIPHAVCGISTDITERKRAEEAALEAARLKSQFLATVSHEIRTPLNSIKGFTALVLDTPLTAEQREHLDIVQSSTATLLGLVNDFLDFAKMDEGKLRMEALPFAPREIVQGVLRALAVGVQEKGLEVASAFAPAVPEILIGDPGRVRQVVVNLVGNAIKFTERGGVSVSADVEARVEDGVVLHFTVADTGIGIPADRQQAIFDPFVQADGATTRRFGGTGLGLAIATRLVAMMGGRIWVESEVGRGSTFHFTARFGLADGAQAA